MTDEEKKMVHIKAELQTLKNEADRPRLLALEEASYAHPGYYSRQPGCYSGEWRLEDGPGVPDGSRGLPVAKRPSSRKLPETHWMAK